jgi:hypothetical protein
MPSNDPQLVCLPRGAALATGPFRGAASRGRSRTCLVVSPALSYGSLSRVAGMVGAAAIVTRMGGDAGLPGTAAPARGQLRRALERDPTEGRGPPCCSAGLSRSKKARRGASVRELAGIKPCLSGRSTVREVDPQPCCGETGQERPGVNDLLRHPGTGFSNLTFDQRSCHCGGSCRCRVSLNPTEKCRTPRAPTALDIHAKREPSAVARRTILPCARDRMTDRLDRHQA